jgi:hypothetical protein
MFKGNVACLSILDSVRLRIPSRSIRDFSTFSVLRNFNKDRTLLMHIS